MSLSLPEAKLVEKVSPPSHSFYLTPHSSPPPFRYLAHPLAVFSLPNVSSLEVLHVPFCLYFSRCPLKHLQCKLYSFSPLQPSRVSLPPSCLYPSDGGGQ